MVPASWTMAMATLPPDPERLDPREQEIRYARRWSAARPGQPLPRAIEGVVDVRTARAQLSLGVGQASCTRGTELMAMRRPRSSSSWPRGSGPRRWRVAPARAGRPACWRRTRRGTSTAGSRAPDGIAEPEGVRARHEQVGAAVVVAAAAGEPGGVPHVDDLEVAGRGHHGAGRGPGPRDPDRACADSSTTWHPPMITSAWVIPLPNDQRPSTT